MAYIALKPVRFDRNYAVGERIPDGAVDAARAAALEAMRMIAKTAPAEAAAAAPAEPEAEKIAPGRKRAAAAPAKGE